MKHFLRWFCPILALCILPAAFLVRSALPVDTQALVEKKYDGWSGVLRAWVYSDWSAESSFNRWLNRCAEEFEHTHNGVYLEFAFAQPEDLNALFSADVPPPELIFYSPGVLRSPDGLTELPDFPGIRPGLQTDVHAVPVAAGGYICVRNPAAETNAFVIPPDGDRRYSEAAVYIIEDSFSEAPAATDSPGIDLGLPALARSGYAVSESAFRDFTDGKILRTIVTQKELARLISLRGEGRGPDWSCEISGTRALCDQLLLASVPETGAERESVAREFVEFLLDKESQAALSFISAFGVTDTVVYPEFSPYAPMETLLRTRLPLVSSVFSGVHEIR